MVTSTGVVSSSLSLGSCECGQRLAAGWLDRGRGWERDAGGLAWWELYHKGAEGPGHLNDGSACPWYPVMRMGAQGGAESQAQAGGQMAELGCQVGAWGEQQGLSSCLGSGLVPGNERQKGLSLSGEQAVPRPRWPRWGPAGQTVEGPSSRVPVLVLPQMMLNQALRDPFPLLKEQQC